MKLCGGDTLKIQVMAKFSRNIFDQHQRSKEVKFLQNVICSRNFPEAQKLEQLERNRKKHLKAHSTGYQHLPIGFELKSVFKLLEVIKGQNSVLRENSFS